MKYLFFLISLVISLPIFAAQQVAIGCKHLRIQLDPQLSNTIVEQEWASGNPRTKEVPAKLELIGCEGQILTSLTLAAPLAKIDTKPIRGTVYPTFLVSVDLTMEAGSYNGPLTIPVEIKNDQLAFSVAKHSNKQIQPIKLTTTGKSAWQRINKQKHDEFLSVNSKMEGNDFVTIYQRFTPTPNGWTVKKLTRKGLWESDAEFPERKFFP